MQLQTGYIYSYPLNIDVSTCTCSTVLHGAPWWSKDLQRIVDFNMLSDRAIVVGDNVLRPGAPQFMYWNSVAGPYETQVVSLREYKQDDHCLDRCFHVWMKALICQYMR